MKILIIHDRGVLEGGGGAETYILDIKNELEKNGNSVKILTGNSGSGKNKFSDEEFICPDRTQLGKLIFYLFNFFAYFKIRKIIKNYNPDIVHLHIITRISPLGLLALGKLPKVITVHDYSLIYPRLKKYFPNLDVCMYSKGACCVKHVGLRYYFEKIRTNILIKQVKSMNMLFTNSHFMATILRKCGVLPTASLEVIGIRLFKQRKLLKNNNLLYVGRIEVEKGVKYLLLSLKKIKEKIPDIKLNIVGSGNQQQEINKMIKKLGLEKNVKQIPNVNRKDLQVYYQNSSLVVVPSLWPEPFGLVGIEAFSVGRPVIASNVGGISEWLENRKMGFLVKPKDADEISNAVIDFLTHIERYKFFEKNTVEKALRYNIETHVKNLIKKYEEALRN